MWCLQTKFMPHWVTHGNNHSTHILHPTLGHALVLCKKDRYQSCFSCYHLTVIICTHLSMSVQPYPSCSRTHTKNHIAITPGHQSSDAEPQHPWPQLTLTVIVTVGITITKKNALKFLRTIQHDIIGTRPVYCHNFLVTQLNRLPITPEQFSSS